MAVDMFVMHVQTSEMKAKVSWSQLLMSGIDLQTNKIDKRSLLRGAICAEAFGDLVVY